ncbi:MAG: hypothetical protein KJ593_07960 [Candidatus Omnitrophica bacterium]|nr:hypothetical protein [Candidatus Omnitrophota bacterium]
MKKVFLALSVIFLLSTVSVRAQEVFSVYMDKNSPDNHYIPSGWMGDHGDVKLNDESRNEPYSGSTCIEISYSSKRSGGFGWTGIYWQNPPNNWGSRQGGYDLTGMTKLTFWAKGKSGGEIIEKLKVGGIKGTYPDSTEVDFGPVELSDTWEKYTINLAEKDLSYISGGFVFVTSADLNPDGAVFYIDEIKFEKDESMKPEVKAAELMPFYVYTDRMSLKNHFTPSGWMGDYGDISIDQASADNPTSGESCVKIVYSGNMSNGARWAGVYWQSPPNNWGNVDGGYDLSKASKLSFWARGEKGGERIEEFKIGGLMGKYSDSDSAGIGPVILTDKWKQYVIDLKGKDLSYISGGFTWSTNVDVNPEGVVFYIDEIRYE